MDFLKRNSRKRRWEKAEDPGKRLSSATRGAQFPPRVGTLVLAQFLGVKRPEIEAADYLSHLKSALEDNIKSSPRRAARAIEMNLPDWRPSSVAEPRPGPWDFASFGQAEKAVVVARTFDFELGS